MSSRAARRTKVAVASDGPVSGRYPDGDRASRIPDESAPQSLESRRRSAKRGAILLALVAGTFYFGFMVLTYFRSTH
jgi:hypothetical protein